MKIGKVLVIVGLVGYLVSSIGIFYEEQAIETLHTEMVFVLLH